VYGGFSQALFFSGSVSIPCLLLDHYFDLGITDREMMFMIHIITEISSRDTESIDERIMRKMGLSKADFKSMVQTFQKKGLLSVNVKPKGKSHPNLPKYDFRGLIDQLFELWGISQYRQMEEASGQSPLEGQTHTAATATSAGLTTVFEQELGRPLTAFECEHIEKWLIAGYSEELIIEALRRGVSAGIRNFRYLDSILREWEKKGIKTRQEVEAEDQNFQSRQTKKGESQKRTSAKSKNKYDNIYL
jgi:DNA replication protein